MRSGFCAEPVTGQVLPSRHGAFRGYILREIERCDKENSETMNNQSGILCLCASVLAMTLMVSGFSPAQTPAPAPAAGAETTVEGSKDTCLGCHGPFDKLTSVTVNYQWQSGDKSSPHRYVPHDSKDIPECSNCHKPHPVPLTSTKGLPKANAEWCNMCHHAGFAPCKSCH